jgi:isoleucyl-tRNA synthetase
MAEQKKEVTLSAEVVDYKSTLNLPHTDFPIRPQAAIDDPLVIERWARDGVYERAMQLNASAKKFILHDGPPYANGSIHLGHAYNKILKDCITKAYRMAGYHVPVVPGWDCHGLPIEWRVTREHSDKNAAEVKALCRDTARHWMHVQAQEFKRLAIIMDWDHPYYTMDPLYEAHTMRAFGVLVEKGFITRKNKTVAWCMHCKTTLASAEIEYADRKDPSLFVLFPLTQETIRAIIPAYVDEPVSFLVWTTTPWTLPFNRAVALQPTAQYALVRCEGALCIVGSLLVPRLEKMMQKSCELVATLSAQQFHGGHVVHPFDLQRTVPIVFDEQVGTEEGTAVVHTAPGCGPSDYELGVRYDLEIYSPVDEAGHYMRGIVPETLAGMRITDGQGWVIQSLSERGLLLHKASITHSYPHCWRCRQGLIFRATKQWFLELHHNDLQEKTLAAIAGITFIPARSANFLRATIAGRLEWCLSRQRVWGVPIPALICTVCDHVLISKNGVDRVALRVAAEGIESWDAMSIAEVAQGALCSECGASAWRKEMDILDVWFDSGVSHAAVLAVRPELSLPADIYVEGVDQHRGWFQSSLLTSMVLHGEPPMRAILSHGFTVDEQGRKMSKSLGNGVEPQELIAKLGTDGLRLWVASMGYEGDIVVSPALVENVAQVYRKIRNTSRFLLQNLYDFDYVVDALPLENLLIIDRAALANFDRFATRMQGAYGRYDLTEVFHGLSDYCTKDLSAIYCDILKDRLYVAAPQSHERRSAQTVLWHILDGMVKLMTPILSCTAELIADYYTHPWKGSVHLQAFPEQHAIAERDLLTEYWDMLVKLRSALLKLLEQQRVAGVIKHSLQASIVYSVAPESIFYGTYRSFVDFVGGDAAAAQIIRELLVVSDVQVALSTAEALMPTDELGVYGRVTHAAGTKCPRCWHWRLSVRDDGLCLSCCRTLRL